MNFDVYPFSFAEEGTITFTAAIPAGGSDTNIYFRFERLPYPNVEPAFNLDPILISGEAELEYTVTVPAQVASNTYSSFLMYVVEQDSPVIVKNIVVTDDPGGADTPSNGGGDSTTGGGSATATAINTDKWFHQTRLPNGWGWFNNEQQHYTNRMENSYVSNGSLKIVAKRESFTDQGRTKQFTSARLNSKYAFKYGRVEVRAKMPTGPAPGLQSGPWDRISLKMAVTGRLRAMAQPAGPTAVRSILSNTGVTTRIMSRAPCTSAFQSWRQQLTTVVSTSALPLHSSMSMRWIGTVSGLSLA